MDEETNTIPLTDEDLAEAVRCTALLANVKVSMWSGERADASIINKAKVDAGASGKVGRAVKNIMNGADTKLKAARSAYSAVRTTHYSFTLPWVSDPHAERNTGPRLLPNMLFEKYLTGMSRAKRTAEQALEAFLESYEADAEIAKTSLGALARDEDYPDVEALRGQFKVGFDFEPIPAGTAFRGLPGHFTAKLAANLASKQKNMLDSATTEAWAQTRSRVKHLADALYATDKKFWSTTVENVRELIVLLPGWNVARDDRLTQACNIIENIMGRVPNADAVREDAVLRKSIADELTKLVAKLDAWGV